MSRQPNSHVIAGNSRLFVKEEHIRAALKKCVRSREARKTTTDDDNLGHCYEVGRRRGYVGRARDERKPYNILKRRLGSRPAHVILPPGGGRPAKDGLGRTARLWAPGSAVDALEDSVIALRLLCTGPGIGQ